MKRKTLVMGLVLTIALMTACGKKAASTDTSSDKGEAVVSTETSATVEGTDNSEVAQAQPEELKKSVVRYAADGSLVYKMEYDETGHPTYEYDNETGNELEYTYELKVEGDNDVLYKYDAAGNLVTKWVYYGHSLKVHVETGYYNGNMIYETTYLENGQTVSSKDYNGELSNSEYDSNGRLVKRVEAGAGYDTFSYDSDGKLSEQKGYDEDDNLLYTVTNEYDKSGNISKESEVYTDGSENVTTSYAYDKNGYLTEIVIDYGDGYVEKEVYVRDKAGKEIEFKFVTVDNGTETEIQRVTKEYDNYGNVVLETYYTMGKKGAEVKYVYTYDNEGRILKKETYYNGELSDVENYEY